MVGRGHDQVREQARVVELAIVVDHTAAKPLLRNGRQALQRFFTAQDARTAKAVLHRQQVINLHADAVEGSLPPRVVRHDKRQVMHQVRRVLPQQAALLQRFHHQRHIALLQIANAAMHQLGGAAGGALAEIFALDKQCFVAARGCVHRNAGTGRATADHQHIPGLRAPRPHGLQHLITIHWQPLRTHKGYTNNPRAPRHRSLPVRMSFD